MMIIVNKLLALHFYVWLVFPPNISMIFLVFKFFIKQEIINKNSKLVKIINLTNTINKACLCKPILKKLKNKNVSNAFYSQNKCCQKRLFAPTRRKKVK